MLIVLLFEPLKDFFPIFLVLKLGLLLERVLNRLLAVLSVCSFCHCHFGARGCLLGRWLLGLGYRLSDDSLGVLHLAKIID